MDARDRIAGYVSAGGRSSRMGTDKAMLEIDGEPLLVRSARVLSQVAGSVTVVGHPERHSGLGVYHLWGIVAHRDPGSYPGRHL